MTIRENVYTVGPDKSIVAAVAEPASVASNSKEVAVVILNTGIIHRVGHQRKYVVLSRELAARGHTVVRFDFGGIGDSDRRRDDLPPLEACLDDIRVVLDWLERSRGIRSFILIGLCSGADHAIIYAGSDRRVVGAALIDPTIPPTSRFLLRYVARRLNRLSSWRSFVTGNGNLHKLIVRRFTPQGYDALYVLLKEAYARALANKVQILAVVTGGSNSRNGSYWQQIQEAFVDLPLNTILRAKFLEDSDHVFLFKHNREQLYAIVLDWIERANFREQSKETRRSTFGQSNGAVWGMASAIAIFAERLV